MQAAACDVKPGENVERERPRPDTGRYFPFLTHNTWRQCQQHVTEFFSHICVLNHVFVMNVATTQQRNGYSGYYFALDSTVFFSRKLTRPRPNARGRVRDRGQLVEAKAETAPRVQSGLKALTSLSSILRTLSD